MSQGVLSAGDSFSAVCHGGRDVMRIPGLELNIQKEPTHYENGKQIHFWLFKLMFQGMMSSFSAFGNVSERISSNRPGGTGSLGKWSQRHLLPAKTLTS